MKRGASGLCGILAVDKPQGVTSHDVVDRIRRMTGEKRVGHAGTLDPMATGLLLVGVGAATRLSAHLTGHDKRYIARIVFGASTNTDDAEGRITTAYTGKNPGEGLEVLKDLDVEAKLSQMVGPSKQLPPLYSAIKKDGVTAYKAARAGESIQLEPRDIEIYSAVLVECGIAPVDLDDGDGGRMKAQLPYWDVELSVSKGTYIRAIARDLGQELGCGAHLGALRRTSIGDCRVEEAHTLDQLQVVFSEKGAIPWMDPADLLGLPALSMDSAQAKAVGNGKSLPDPVGYAQDNEISLVREGRLLAVYKKDGEALKPSVVIPGGVSGVEELAALPWDDALALDCPQVIAIGVFDGLHLGHRCLLRDAAVKARACGAGLVVLTFDRDPDEVFCDVNAPAFKLTTNADRVSALSAFVRGLAADARVVTIETPSSTTTLESLAFLDECAEKLNPVALFVGEGFRFGKMAKGDTSTMAKWCQAHDVDLTVHALVEEEQAPVSSTRIRQSLERGDVAQVTMLRGGVMHRMRGVVEEGRHDGTGFGFATANLSIPNSRNDVMLPAEGVYGGYANIHDPADAWPLAMPAAINVGVAKSFEEARANIEAHILGIDQNLYGKELDIWFVEWLREPRVFESTEELIETVMGNIQWVRDNLQPGGER